MHSLARCHHLTMPRGIHRHQVIHENSTGIDHALRLQQHLFSGLHIHELHPGDLPVLVMHNPGNLRFVKYHAPIIRTGLSQINCHPRIIKLPVMINNTSLQSFFHRCR